MDNNGFLLASGKRKSLSIFTRIFNSILGIILILFVIINYQSQWLPLLILGIVSTIYGVVGLEMFKTNYCISIANNTLEIVKSFQQDIVIDLNKVVYIAMKYNELQVHYADYVKTYNIPWLTGEEYQILMGKLEEINKKTTITSL